ncbi:autotransporter assembly complex family protein [Dongia sp.]|uniref:autotransporter assembly complex protein TamA n=1 Tax=Dongia sp. TaxID=1977262 RepID=UPI0035B1C90D
MAPLISDDPVLKEAVLASSTLVELEESPPDTLFGLTRRAEEDIPRIEKALRSAGYYDGTVVILVDGQDVAADAGAAEKEEPADKRHSVDILVTPGKLFAVQSVAVEITAHIAQPLTAALRKNEPARAAAILAERERLLNATLDQGYPFAKVTLRPATIDHATKTVSVTYVVEPGPIATMGAVNVTGLDRIDPAFMRQRAQFPPGKLYQPSEINALRDDLRSLDVFDAVKVTPAEQLAPDGSLPVDVLVAERKRHFIGLGANYATDRGAGLKAYWGDRNLFGGAERLRLDAEISGFGENSLSDTDYNLSAAFRKPDYLMRDQDLVAGLVLADTHDEDTFDKQSATATAGIERRIDETMSWGAGLEAERSRITEDGASDDFLLFGPTLSFKRDTTADLLNPVSGSRLVLSTFAFPEFLGSSQDVIGTNADFSTYFDLSGDGNLVLAGRVAGASVFGGETEDLPADRRLYAGGGGSVRGYEFRSISPLDEDDDPAGGRSSLIASLELRYRFLDDYGIVPFFDAGTVSDEVFPSFDEDIQYAAGVGLRYYTAIGPIRADFAVPLNPRGSDDAFQFYISIGQAF